MSILLLLQLLPDLLQRGQHLSDIDRFDTIVSVIGNSKPNSSTAPIVEVTRSAAGLRYLEAVSLQQTVEVTESYGTRSPQRLLV